MAPPKSEASWRVFTSSKGTVLNITRNFGFSCSHNANIRKQWTKLCHQRLRIFKLLNGEVNFY